MGRCRHQAATRGVLIRPVMHPSRRIQSVQSPVIPIIGELVRATPGAISLGQGVVNYGPPPQAAQRAAQYAAGSDHAYKPVQGLPDLLSAIREKHLAENEFDPTRAR